MNKNPLSIGADPMAAINNLMGVELDQATGKLVGQNVRDPSKSPPRLTPNPTGFLTSPFTGAYTYK